MKRGADSEGSSAAAKRGVLSGGSYILFVADGPSPSQIESLIRLGLKTDHQARPTMFTINPPRALWALIAALLALALFMNGVAMMGVPLSWYGFIPGVAATGPFNEHFVRDVGAAYVAAAVSLAFAIGRLERTAAAPAAAFLVLHALIHLIPLLGAQRLTGIFVCQPPERTALLGEIVGVYAPALIALALTVPARWQELWPFPNRAIKRLIAANERRLGVKMDYVREMAESGSERSPHSPRAPSPNSTSASPI